MEVLSPAGNLEKLKIAVDYGADAVYAGLKEFSLRERAGNFSFEELEQGIKYAHERGKKVYITLNIFARNKDIQNIKSVIKEVSTLAPDAFIVSDLGVLSVVRENTDLPVHISTQANVTNYEAVKVYRALGASRIILARELSLNEIKEIKDKVPDIELEVFVHGAMCMAYSGRCLLSDYLAFRGANKGACAQSCRWKYYIMEEKREGEIFPIEEDSKGTYIFNSKDLCLLPYLDKLFDIGVDSVKIEGRVKSLYYVAVTTAVYKRAVELLKKRRELFRKELPFLMRELEKVSHRPYTSGFLIPESEELRQHYETSSYIREYKFLAIFNGNFWVVKNRFRKGDKVEVFLPDGSHIETEVTDIESQKGEKLEEVHPNYIVKLKFPINLPLSNKAILRKRKIT